jgi:hypothetical protein
MKTIEPIESIEDVPIEQPIQSPETSQTQTSTPHQPTLIVETEPSVRFTDFDQVIQQRGGKTHIDYVEQARDQEETDAFQILDDEGEPLSDFEDLDAEELGNDDYETL